MSEYIPLILALVIIVLIFAVIYLGVSYAFEIYENRRMREEINNGFHYTIGFNESLAKEAEFLKDQLRPYRRLAEKYGCHDAAELETLLIDLQDSVEESYNKNKELRHHKYKRCLRNAEGCLNKVWYYTEVHDRGASNMMWKWRQHWLELAEKFKPEDK